YRSARQRAPGWRKFFLWGRVYPGQWWWGRYRSLNLAPLAGIKPAPQVESPVGPAGGSRQRAAGEAEFLFVGPGFSRPTVVGPIPQPEPSSAGRHKADPTGCPAGEPSGRSRQRAPGVAEVLFVGPGSSRPTAVGPTRQLEPGPA